MWTLNRDISNLIDPVIQDFIYQNGLYLRDSQNKPLLDAGTLSFQWVDEPEEQLVDELTERLGRTGRPSAPASSTGRTASCFCGERGRRAAGLCELPLSVGHPAVQRPRDTGLADRIRLRSAGTTLLHHLRGGGCQRSPCGTAFSC